MKRSNVILLYVQLRGVQEVCKVRNLKTTYCTKGDEWRMRGIPNFADGFNGFFIQLWSNKICVPNGRM